MPDRPEYLRYDRARAGAPARVGAADGDPAGERCFADVCCDRPRPRSGGVLPEVTVAYETWGRWMRDNVALVCHALTGDSHAAGAMGPGHKSDGWWDDLIK